MSVGDPAVTYHLHRDLLCERCPYFRGCFDGSFKETDDRKTVLTEESPEAFDEVLRWVYQSRVSDPQNGETNDMALIHAYILADKLCMEELKNSIVTMLWRYYDSNYMTTTGGLTLLEENGLPTCKLRSLLLWELSGCIVAKGYTKVLLHAPDLKEYIGAGGEGVVELFEATAGCTEADLEELDWNGEDKCRWHEHLMTPVCAGAKTYEDGTSKKPDK